MMKQAWRSYLASLHPRNLRKAYDEGKLFWLLYWLIIYPTMMRFATDSLEAYEVIHLVVFRIIPYLLMGWSNINSKYLMSKMMYICPIKEEARQEYIKYVLFIKIGVSLLLSILIEGIYSIFYGFSIIKILIMVVMIFSIGIATYISLETFGKMDKKTYTIVKDKTDNTKHHWLNNLVLIAALMVIGAVSILDVGAEESLALCCNVFIVAMTILLIIMDVIMVRGEYKATVALAGDYELSFRILGKVEKQVKFDLFQKKEVNDV